ncbi:MAG: hypothetical protein WBW94_07860 [Anaerolineales bacterium]
MLLSHAQQEKRSAALSPVLFAIGLTTFKIIVSALTNSLGILEEIQSSSWRKQDCWYLAQAVLSVQILNVKQNKDH